MIFTMNKLGKQTPIRSERDGLVHSFQWPQPASRPAELRPLRPVGRVPPPASCAASRPPETAPAAAHSAFFILPSSFPPLPRNRVGCALISALALSYLDLP